MVLQPSEARRRSGSHYTPRALTEPIVRTTLEPILERLRCADGKPPRPEAILDLKVCDPAMGSGAFLVEACRQLGDKLVEAWHAHGEATRDPAGRRRGDLRARLIAQRCLYGVDRNPVAVDLAKVSLWLVTLAKDHRAHLRGPRAAPRRLARRAFAPPDRGVSLGGRRAALSRWASRR
jgi:type II restriction/modification system DNA methylase subunit YeeA